MIDIDAIKSRLLLADSLGVPNVQMTADEVRELIEACECLEFAAKINGRFVGTNRPDRYQFSFPHDGSRWCTHENTPQAAIRMAMEIVHG